MAEENWLVRRDCPENSPFPSSTDDEIIAPVLDDLNACPAVERLARDIAATIESTMWVVGRRRSTVAATSVYVAGVLRGGDVPVFKQTEVAEAASVSVGSIYNQYEDVMEVYQATRRERSV